MGSVRALSIASSEVAKLSGKTPALNDVQKLVAHHEDTFNKTLPVTAENTTLAEKPPSRWKAFCSEFKNLGKYAKDIYHTDQWATFTATKGLSDKQIKAKISSQTKLGFKVVSSLPPTVAGKSLKVTHKYVLKRPIGGGKAEYYRFMQGRNNSTDSLIAVEAKTVEIEPPAFEAVAGDKGSR